MRSYFKYLLVLAPLAVLLALPCATKRQIKLDAGVLNTEITTNKGENTKFCADVSVEKDQIQYTIKRFVTGVAADTFTSSIPPVFSSNNNHSDFRSLVNQVIEVPFFLLYRKLIIYF